MQKTTDSRVPTEPNFWLRQAAELAQLQRDEDAAALRELPKKDRDLGWAIILIVWWFAWVLLSFWKTAPGGLASIPTFLILLAFGTTVAITAWVKTR